MVGAPGAISGVMGALGTLSEGPCFRVGIPWFLYHLGGSTRLDDARLLVAHSVCEWASGVRR